MDEDEQIPDRAPRPIPEPPPCEPTAADPVETAFLDQLAAQDPINPGKPFTDPQ